MSDTSSTDTGFDPGRLRTAPTQMVRSRDDRYVAGVCGGLARYLGIDPVVVRVLVAALTVVGGIGLVFYAAAWLLAPEEGAEQNLLESHLPVSPRTRVLGWIVAGIIVVAAVVGSGPWFDWGWIGPFPLLGLAVLVWILARPRSSAPDTGATDTGTTTAEATTHEATEPEATEPEATTTEGTEPMGPGSTEPADTPDAIYRTSETEAATSGAAPEPSPAASASASATTARLAPSRPPEAPRHRDQGVLTWLTLAAVVAVIGVLWLVDQSGADIDGPAYLASSLGVVAAGMLVGTWWGNGRWLIPAGAALTMTLIVVSQLPVWKFGQIDETPTRSADVLSSYEMGAGQIRLDLTDVDDLAALDGRTITLVNGLGEILVVVPENLDVTVTAQVNGGDLEILGREANGADASTQYTDPDDADPNVRLELDGSLGHLEVTRS